MIALIIKNIPKYIWIIVKHPFTGIAIGALIAIIIWVVSTAKKEPVFVVSPPELVAQTVPEEEKLKILWEGNVIKNVALVKIGIWNQGSRYIDKSDISTTNPIQIKPLEKVNILAVQILKTSRPTLNFETKAETDADGIETVLIKIKGDEALEKFDGALFHVLFSGKREVTWKVIGRIKGVPKGFQKRDWTPVKKNEDSWLFPALFYPISIGFFIGLFIFFIIDAKSDIIDARRRDHKPPWIFILGAHIMILFILVFLIKGYYFYLTRPPWL